MWPLLRYRGYYGTTTTGAVEVEPTHPEGLTQVFNQRQMKVYLTPASGGPDTGAVRAVNRNRVCVALYAPRLLYRLVRVANEVFLHVVPVPVDTGYPNPTGEDIVRHIGPQLSVLHCPDFVFGGELHLVHSPPGDDLMVGDGLAKGGHPGFRLGIRWWLWTCLSGRQLCCYTDRRPVWLLRRCSAFVVDGWPLVADRITLRLIGGDATGHQDQAQRQGCEDCIFRDCSH